MVFVPRILLNQEKPSFTSVASDVVSIVVHNLHLPKAYYVPETIPSNPHDSSAMGCIIPIFQRRKLRLREVMKLAQGYMVHKW